MKFVAFLFGIVAVSGALGPNTLSAGDVEELPAEDRDWVLFWSSPMKAWCDIDYYTYIAKEEFPYGLYVSEDNNSTEHLEILYTDDLWFQEIRNKNRLSGLNFNRSGHVDNGVRKLLELEVLQTEQLTDEYLLKSCFQKARLWLSIQHYANWTVTIEDPNAHGEKEKGRVVAQGWVDNETADVPAVGDQRAKKIVPCKYEIISVKDSSIAQSGLAIVGKGTECE